MPQTQDRASVVAWHTTDHPGPTRWPRCSTSTPTSCTTTTSELIAWAAPLVPRPPAHHRPRRRQRHRRPRARPSPARRRGDRGRPRRGPAGPPAHRAEAAGRRRPRPHRPRRPRPPWPDLGPADLVWASASMHHMADPDRTLARVRDTLRPGGAAHDHRTGLVPALPRRTPARRWRSAATPNSPAAAHEAGLHMHENWGARLDRRRLHLVPSAASTSNCARRCPPRPAATPR